MTTEWPTTAALAIMNAGGKYGGQNEAPYDNSSPHKGEENYNPR